MSFSSGPRGARARCSGWGRKSESACNPTDRPTRHLKNVCPKLTRNASNAIFKFDYSTFPMVEFEAGFLQRSSKKAILETFVLVEHVSEEVVSETTQLSPLRSAEGPARLAPSAAGSWSIKQNRVNGLCSVHCSIIILFVWISVAKNWMSNSVNWRSLLF